MHNLFILGGLSIQITPLLCLLVAGVFGIVVFVRGKHIEGEKKHNAITIKINGGWEQCLGTVLQS
jgi:hypothetical protein